MNELNIKEEIFYLNLTEWEIDTIVQCLKLANYPGTHVYLAYNLMQKVNASIEKAQE